MVLTWIDYAVIAAYLVAITAFGSWFARFQKTTRDYFLTDRSVPWWAICFTIVATETSTLSFIGVPAGAYAGNMTFLQLAVGYIVGRLLVSVLFIPAYFRGELFTSYELLNRRFGPPVKNVAAVIFMVTRTFADGIRLFATALVISVVTQVPVTWTVIVLGAAMIVYTVRGGVSAVIWTDVVQMFIYVGGALLVFFGLLQQIPGGWSEVTRIGCRSLHALRSQHRSNAGLHVLGGAARRRCADARHARHRSVPGAAAALGAIGAGSVNRTGAERLHRLRAVHAVPADRRDALHVLPAHSPAAAARHAPTKSCRSSSSPRCRTASPDSSSRRSSRRRCRRRSTRWRRPRSTTST